VLKKILIIVPLTAVFVFFGWQYSLESTRKHEEFLLTQSLFPEISEFSQKNQMLMTPKKIELKKKSFTLYIEAENPDHLPSYTTFVAEWLKSNLKFHDYDFKIEIQARKE